MKNISLQSLEKRFTKKQVRSLTKDDYRHIAKEFTDAYLETGVWVDIVPIVEEILEEKERRKRNPKRPYTAPTNEKEFRELFEKYATSEFGLRLSISQNGCPDIVALDREKRITVRIELEFKASNFWLHKHDHNDIDEIYCWEKDIRSKHIPIIECKNRLIKYCKGKK